MDTGRPPSPGRDAAARAHAEAERERYRNLPKAKRRALVQTRDREAQQAADRRRYVNNRPARIDAVAQRQAEARRTGSQAAQLKARATAKVALDSGAIHRPAQCQAPGCTNKPTQMHHTDYSKPLQVQHLCSVHHGAADRNTEASKRG